MPPKELKEGELTARRSWKDLLRLIMEQSPRTITSSELADSANHLLEQAGSQARVTAAKINHYRAKPKGAQPEAAKTDVRVPRNALVANALAWALEELGAWAKLDVNQKKEQQSDLVELLGFKKHELHLNFLKGSEAVVGLLHEISMDSKPECIVLHIHSAIGFFTGKDSQIAKSIIECVFKGIRILYVISENWPADFQGESVVLRLKNMLEIMLEVCGFRGDELKKLKERFFYIHEHLGKAPPSIQSLFLRVGAESCLADSDSHEENLNPSLLCRSKLMRCWFEISRDIAVADDSRRSEWLVPHSVDQYSRFFSEKWLKLRKAKDCHIKKIFSEENYDEK